VNTSENRFILVVDDNEQALTLVREALQTRGFKVLTLNRGAQVMATLDSKKGESIDLVILDLVMPDADGMELAGEILAKRPKMKILVMSGYADDVVVHGIFERDNVDFLGKPFSIRDLFARVNTLFAQVD
jgi:two-component system, cell cycle sensor histidine kinase and response regulator CckA